MTTPLKPCPDAVEALAKYVFHGDTELVMQKARECVAELAAQGYHITRPTMTDAELEREACYLYSRAKAGNDDVVDEIIAFAKRYRR